MQFLAWFSFCYLLFNALGLILKMFIVDTDGIQRSIDMVVGLIPTAMMLAFFYTYLFG